MSDKSVVCELIRCPVALESYRMGDMFKKDQAVGRELGISASSSEKRLETKFMVIGHIYIVEPP